MIRYFRVVSRKLTEVARVGNVVEYLFYKENVASSILARSNKKKVDK